MSTWVSSPFVGAAPYPWWSKEFFVSEMTSASLAGAVPHGLAYTSVRASTPMIQEPVLFSRVWTVHRSSVPAMASSPPSASCVEYPNVLSNVVVTVLVRLPRPPSSAVRLAATWIPEWRAVTVTPATVRLACAVDCHGVFAVPETSAPPGPL